MIRPIILCKAPVVAKVKTRLTPQLTDQQACEVHRLMASYFIHKVSAYYPQAWLAVDDLSHPFFQQFHLKLVAQGFGCLGDKIQRLMHQNIQSGMQASLFLGTDSPHLSTARLKAAHLVLQNKDVVVAPVEDGGYQMIAVKGDQPALFHGISWGSDQVMAQSLERIVELGLSVNILSTSFDVDRFEDLIRLLQRSHSFKFWSHHTGVISKLC
ncbi:MAG: TIGR04282 family arsenosugar biosynthesis glycosyltransferase [Mariprofundaceae bacterium]|nr:TIGR04282 family arsenosugar biosynthesis glycosyltransferase [Mariprofundaceae bacterium]